MGSPGVLVTPSGYHRSWRALIASQYSGLSCLVQDYISGKTDKEPQYLSSFPPNTIVFFIGNDGTRLFDVNAIAYYLGNDTLRGEKLEHFVTQWVNFADEAILPSVATWVYPCLGVTQYNKQSTEKAKENIQSVLSFLNTYLGKITFFVGDRLSQADITLFTVLHPLFTHVYEESYRKPFPHLMRWFTTVANQPAVVAVCGKVVLCTKEAHFDSEKYAKLHPKGDGVKTAKQKQQKEKPKQKKPDPKPQEDDLDEDDDMTGASKPSKNPLDDLPDGGFDMNEFKRTYCNENIQTVAIPYFWNRFDPSTHSLWFCEYQYPEELGKVFMTCNLVGGMFQRLQKLQKFAFASMCIFGNDQKSSISGLWFWRGTGLAFELHPDFQVDYESYSWRKLDPNADETKKLVHDYFLQEFADKPFNQGKIFK